MIRYLELIEYICLVISISNFIAIGLTLKKKKQIFKTMYFINNFGVVTISNLIIWIEGWYVDENNLSGSTMSFFLNFCNIALFILNNIMTINCKKRRVSDKLCISLKLPSGIISNPRKPVKAERLTLTGFRGFKDGF